MKVNKLNKKRGISLIIVIMVMAFLFSIGLLLLSITGTGPYIAGNVRFYQEAFNAAEAGFDSAWASLNDLFISGAWTSFAGHYLEQPLGIDNPDKNNPLYFRRLTDEEILSLLDSNNDGQADYPNVLYFNEDWIEEGKAREDLDYRYTCFLINDEAGGVTEDPGDAILVCIGVVKAQKKILATSRLEVKIAFEGH